MAPCLLLCALLFALAEGFSHDEMKGAVLKHLGLGEVPRIHKRDLENLVVPAHIKTKYLNLLKVHHERRRRSLPSLAGILRGIPGNAGKTRPGLLSPGEDESLPLSSRLSTGSV